MMNQRESDLFDLIKDAQNQHKNLLPILYLNPNLPEIHKKALGDAIRFANDIECANYTYLQTIAMMFANPKAHVLNNIEDHYYQVRNGG